MLRQKIGFIGSGQMAQALAAGFLKAGLLEASQLRAADPSSAAREAFLSAAPGAGVEGDNAAVLERSDIIFLAVKPQGLAGVAKGLQGHLTQRHLLVSILAG